MEQLRLRPHLKSSPQIFSLGTNQDQTRRKEKKANPISDQPKE